MIIRVAPLLLIILTLGYFAFAEGARAPATGETSGEGAGAASASSSLVVVATLTPVPGQEGARLASLPAVATATDTPVGSETPEALASDVPGLAAASATGVTGTTATPVPAETATPTETSTPVGTATQTATPTVTPSPTPVTPTIVPLPGLSSAETQIFVDHNALRESAGLARFQVHDTLMAIARERAAIMASLQQMTHYNPNGGTVFDMMAAYAYPHITGSENIHFNYGYSDQQSVQVAVESWIASPSHYASMVNSNLGRIGIGIATGANGYLYYSVVFSD